MTRFMTLTTAALIATTGTAAFAVETNLEAKLERYVGDVDMSVLSNTDKAMLRTTITGGGTFSERRAVVQDLLSDKGALVESSRMMAPVEANYEGLEVAIQRYEPSFNIDNYEDEELLLFQNALYSGNTESEKRDLILSMIKS